MVAAPFFNICFSMRQDWTNKTSSQLEITSAEADLPVPAEVLHIVQHFCGDTRVGIVSCFVA
jgi:hypothetical protein